MRINNDKNGRTWQKMAAGGLLLTAALGFGTMAIQNLSGQDASEKTANAPAVPMIPAVPTASAAPAASAVPTAPAVPAVPAATPSAANSSAGAELYSTLRQREQRLVDDLSELKPTDADYQERIQSIGTELRDVQSRLQELSFSNSAFPSGFGGPLPDSAANGGGVPVAGGLGIQAGMPPVGAENGMGLGNPTAGGLGISGNRALSGGFDPMTDPALLKQIKEELTFQLKQLQQTLRMLGPQDEALQTTLKEQETDLLEQLKQVNEKLGKSDEPAKVGEESAQDGTISSVKPPLLPGLNGEPAKGSAESLSGAGALPTTPGMVDANDVAQRLQKVSQAAVLLREAGLFDLANQALNQAETLADPNRSALTVDPALTGLQEGAGNDWFTPPGAAKASDLAELKEASQAIGARVDQMVENLKAIETQLKLLSRQMVDQGNPATPPVIPAEKPVEDDSAPKN